MTRTLNLFRHNYRPVLQILTAIYVSLQGLQGHTNTRPTPSYTRWKTITDMVTLKMTWTTTIVKQHTATITMVQPLEGVMISTLQIMQDTVITLTVVAIRIQVHIVIIIFGPEVRTSTQRRWKFTMKCLFKCDFLGKQNKKKSLFFYVLGKQLFLAWLTIFKLSRFYLLKLFSSVVVVRLINRPGFCKISGEWGLTSLSTKPIHHKNPFIWRKLVPGRRLTRLPVARASQLFLHFLTKLDEPLFVKKSKKKKLARRLKDWSPPTTPTQLST